MDNKVCGFWVDWANNLYRGACPKKGDSYKSGYCIRSAFCLLGNFSPRGSLSRYDLRQN